MLGVARDRGAAGRQRSGRRQIDRGLLFELGQRRVLVLLDELGGRIDVLLATVHGWKGKVSAGREPPMRGRYGQEFVRLTQPPMSILGRCERIKASRRLRSAAQVIADIRKVGQGWSGKLMINGT